MRGHSNPEQPMFYAIDVEEMIPRDHPLRDIKLRVDAELRKMRTRFDAAYSKNGRPSVAPERLIKATLLQALYSIRSERQLCQQIGYNILFRWFLDLNLDEGVWDHSTFSANRERFAQHGLMAEFFQSSTTQALREDAASREHFSVDGTLIEAWASMKSFQPKQEAAQESQPGGGPDDADSSGSSADAGSSNKWVDWKDKKRSNDTHASRTDPEALLMRKGIGREAHLSHSMHVLMENRNGLIMDIALDAADGTAERRAARKMLARARARQDLSPQTLGADKGYDDGEFLRDLEEKFGIEPHVAIRAQPKCIDDAESLARSQACQRATTERYGVSRRIRMRIEEIMGWLKCVAGLRKTRFVGRWKTQLYIYAAAATYNFLRLGKLANA